MKRFRALPLALVAAVGCTGAGPTEVTAPPPTPIVAAEATPPPLPAEPGPVLGIDLAPPRIRVLLRRTDEPISLPQPGRPYRLRDADTERWLWGPLTLTLDDPAWWQVGAFGDPVAALAVVERLRAALGPGADVMATLGPDGLERVRVRWPADPPGDPARVLSAAGFADAYPVREAAHAVVESSHGPPVTVTGEALLEPAGDWPVAVSGRRYRGRLWLRAVGAELQVVNELALEAYLRGVVPVEMGPGQFPQLDALMAQAVAARTYAVAHLGDHDDEGYDLCATPACQAYHGAGAEHPLSDRAVRDTAGRILTFDGAPIDAMYTSTCGGRTDDARRLFPDREQPYLRGVECAWDRPLELPGRMPDGGWSSLAVFEEELALTALGLARDGASPAELIRAVAAACGVPAATPAAGLPTSEAFAEAVIDAGGLRSAGRHLVAMPSAVGRLIDLGDLFGRRLAHPPDTGWEAGWHLRAALVVLELQGVVMADRGEAVPHPDGVAIYPRRAERSQPLAAPLPLWLRWGDELAQRARLRIRPGTTLERWRRGDRLLAVTAVRSDGGAEADRRSAWRQWARERHWSELALQLGMPDLHRLEVTERTDAGRVVGLAAIGRLGERKEWSGFDVRRALDLPETLFTLHALTREDGTRLVRFLGRGWGHGVGMCQNGAYGLARSGMTYDRILAHYYPGTTLQSWP